MLSSHANIHTIRVVEIGLLRGVHEIHQRDYKYIYSVLGTRSIVDLSACRERSGKDRLASRLRERLPEYYKNRAGVERDKMIPTHQDNRDHLVSLGVFPKSVPSQ